MVRRELDIITANEIMDAIKRLNEFAKENPDKVAKWKEEDLETKKYWAEIKKNKFINDIHNSHNIYDVHSMVTRRRKEVMNREVVGTCPNCGCDLIVRTARATGNEFIGCTGFPRCKYTERI